MYRIRTAAGSEATYNSLEEFTAAVRRGAVVPEDEIFHTRANRWLDVKSHPHYRLAITSGGAPVAPAPPSATTAPHAPVAHHAPAASAPAPSAPPAPLRPVPVPSTAHAPQQSRAQVFERPSAPVARPVQQTALHPRLQADSAIEAKAPAPAPVSHARPPKSKDLTFVDTGLAPSPARPQTSVAEMTAPAQVLRTELKPAAKPAPLPKAPDNELDFLIMDGGIESPVRTSAGHMTIPEDLDLLFAASLDPAASPPQGPPAGKTVVGAPPRSPAMGAKSGKNPAIVIPPASGAATPLAATPAPVAPVDLSIPGEAILTDPVEPPTAPAPQSWAAGSKPNYLGGGIALIVIVAGLLAWRPWSGVPQDSAARPMADTSPSFNPMGASLVTPVSATTPPETAPAPGKLGGTPVSVLKPTDVAAVVTKPSIAPADSGREDVVLAAGSSDFGGSVPVSGSIEVGSVPAASAAAAGTAPSELVRRLQAAQKDAQQDLNERLGTIGFRGVINPTRLSTPALVAAARTAWSGGVDAIRSYRSRLARVEKAYEDSVLTAQRAQRWSPAEMRAWASRQSLSEPSDASQLADLMFTQVNEGLEILASLPGEYSVKSDQISFKDPASATRYASIRGWVEQRMSTWSATPEGARPYSISATLRALGDGFPAVQ